MRELSVDSLEDGCPQMDLNVKVNKTFRNGKKVGEWIAIGLKLLTNFFTQFSSRFAAWRNPGSLAQEMDEARDAREARKLEDERQARILEEERRARDAAIRLAREMQKTLNQADVARLYRENELRRKQRDLGHDGPSIEI